MNVELDFSAFIAERTRHFVGREWVFQRVEAWLADRPGLRTFLLAAGPGTGKSAIAGRLVQMSDGAVERGAFVSLKPDFLAHRHFCQGGLDSTLSPTTFVQVFSQALANRYPAFREALQALGARHVHLTVNQDVANVAPGGQVIGAKVLVELKGGGDARSLFDEAVRRPLAELCKAQAPGEPIVVLIDSLDEALSFHPENNIVQLLRLTNDFPAAVRFVFTCRSNNDRAFDLVGGPTLDLIADAPPGLDEVRQYALGRLRDTAPPARDRVADAVTARSRGNFLYAFHVLSDILRAGPTVADIDGMALPDKLEGVYRQFLQRELASSDSRWNDVYRPLLGPIAVAHGDGLTKAQLIGITDLAEDTASDVLKVCEQYLVGGDSDTRPLRIYHQSFRDFLLTDAKYNVFPAERHDAVARYFQDLHGASWDACEDDYALRYTPMHWAEAALGATQESRRATRTQALVELTRLLRYQRRYEQRIGDLPQLEQLLLRATQVAATNRKIDMLPWLLRAAKACVRFRRDFFEAETVLSLAERGQLEQAEARLSLFVDLTLDWLRAARLILAWLALAAAPQTAGALHARIAKELPGAGPLSLLAERLHAAGAGQAQFPSTPPIHVSLEDGRQRVRRIGGQDLDRELLNSIDESLIVDYAPIIVTQAGRGYASAQDARMLVQAARVPGQEAAGTALFDEYVGAHAGYNYVEYRNQSLWLMLHAVLHNHPTQDWVRDRLRLLLAMALSGGGVDFEEMLPLTATALQPPERGMDARAALAPWLLKAHELSAQLQRRRGANDSWGIHKRRFIALMELQQLVAGDGVEARRLLQHIRVELPGGFSGFQAPAHLRLADAVRACRIDTPQLLDEILLEAVKSAHHIQDYRFCARITARCNTLRRWHRTELEGPTLADMARRLAASPGDVRFAADHRIHEQFIHRGDDPEQLSVAPASEAATLEQLADVFQRPVLEFVRLNPERSLSEPLPHDAIVPVPDPGLPPLLAIHLSARLLADDTLVDQRVALIRSLVPLAVKNATALDTVLSYLLIAARIDDPDLLREMAGEIGPVEFRDSAAPTTQVGPDGVPT